MTELSVGTDAVTELSVGTDAVIAAVTNTDATFILKVIYLVFDTSLIYPRKNIFILFKQFWIITIRHIVTFYLLLYNLLIYLQFP